METGDAPQDLKEHEFSITGFGFAVHSLDFGQKETIRNIAERLFSGDDAVPGLGAVEMIEIIGHAIGTSNLEMHANTRAEAVLNELKNSLRQLGASNAEIAKIKRGEPVTRLSSAPAQVGDRQVRIVVHTAETSLIKSVGAWCGSATLAHPERDVDFAAENGINRFDIVINDHSASRAEREFTVRNTARIEALCRRAQDNGIETHLMSWIMPYERYIEGAAERLIPLCGDVGAASLQWDAEEPWVLARKQKRMGFKEAASLIAEKFSDLSCEMGVTAIGFASIPKVGPLVEVCDYGVPQAYSTTRSGVKPGSGQKMLHKRWRNKFGKPIVMGLAAFRQSGIPGHTVESAMKACIKASGELGCTAVIYWSLQHIRSSSTVRKVIAGIRG
jgi:hypothetical protein